MKLKTVEVNGATYAEVSDGKPVFVLDDGKEIAFDAPHTSATITRLNGEAKSHRERAEAAETKLKPFEGLSDPAAARKALETVANLDHKKLVDAGEVEKVKAEAIKAVEERYAPVVQKVQTLESELYNEKIGGAFSRSKLIAEKFVIPADLVQSRFGSNFKIEEGGKMVATDLAGNRIFSRARPGEIADFEEALETLVDQYPYKDQILKGTGRTGSGTPPNGAGGGGKRTMTRSEFEKLPPMERAGVLKGGTQLTD
jgi:hypothetical protein